MWHSHAADGSKGPGSVASVVPASPSPLGWVTTDSPGSATDEAGKKASQTAEVGAETHLEAVKRVVHSECALLEQKLEAALERQFRQQECFITKCVQEQGWREVGSSSGSVVRRPAEPPEPLQQPPFAEDNRLLKPRPTGMPAPLQSPAAEDAHQPEESGASCSSEAPAQAHRQHQHAREYDQQHAERHQPLTAEQLLRRERAGDKEIERQHFCAALKPLEASLIRIETALGRRSTERQARVIGQHTDAKKSPTTSVTRSLLGARCKSVSHLGLKSPKGQPSSPSSRYSLKNQSSAAAVLLSAWALDIEEKFAEATISPVQKRCYSWIMRFLDWCISLEEPPRSGYLPMIVDSLAFDWLCATVILLNAGFTIYASNYEINHLREETTPVIGITDACFTGFYVLEFVLKLLVHRLYLFCNTDMRWNLFDFALVVFAIYGQIIMLIMSSTGVVNLTFMRTLRVLKMAKILRVVRVARIFTELRLMLNSVLGSFVSLFWAFVLLAFIFYLFALFFVQGLTSYLLDHADETSPERKQQLLLAFGSVESAMLSLYKSVTGGADWQEFFDNPGSVQMLEGTGFVNKLFFVFFIFFIQIALLNILTGIFVENAMKLAQPDRDSLAFERRKRDVAESEELTRLCMQVDTNNSGTISAEEFYAMNRKMRNYFAVMGLDITDAECFFEMLAALHDDQEVDIPTFVTGCMKLKGTATSLDLQRLMFETKLIYRNQRNFHEFCIQNLEELREDMCNLRAETGAGSKDAIAHNGPTDIAESKTSPHASTAQASQKPVSVGGGGHADDAMAGAAHPCSTAPPEEDEASPEVQMLS